MTAKYDNGLMKKCMFFQNKLQGADNESNKKLVNILMNSCEHTYEQF